MNDANLENGILKLDNATLVHLSEKTFLSDRTRELIRVELARRGINPYMKSRGLMSIGTFRTAYLVLVAVVVFFLFSTGKAQKVIYFLVVAGVVWPLLAKLIIHGHPSDNRSRGKKMQDEQGTTPADGDSTFSMLMKLSAENRADDLSQALGEIHPANEYINKKVDKKGYSLLMVAAANGANDAVNVLLGAGANLYLRSPKGSTAFHFASSDDVLVSLLCHES